MFYLYAVFEVDSKLVGAYQTVIDAKRSAEDRSPQTEVLWRGEYPFIGCKIPSSYEGKMINSKIKFDDKRVLQWNIYPYLPEYSLEENDNSKWYENFNDNHKQQIKLSRKYWKEHAFNNNGDDYDDTMMIIARLSDMIDSLLKNEGNENET